MAKNDSYAEQLIDEIERLKKQIERMKNCGYVAKGYVGAVYCTRGKSCILILLNEPCQYWTKQKGEIPILWDMIRSR